MYTKAKEFLFTATYLLLLAVFCLKLCDPVMAGNVAFDKKGNLPIYAHWRDALSFLYFVSDMLCIPLNWLYNQLVVYLPFLKSPWFPSFDMSDIPGSVSKAYMFHKDWTFLKPTLELLQSKSYSDFLAGTFTWMPLLTIGALALVKSGLESLVNFLKNFIWNIFAEFTFSRKKQEQYARAIEREQESREVLSSQLKSLSETKDTLETSVVTDEMTKAYNKKFFVEKLTQELAYAKKNRTLLALVMMDIDHFKKFNDTYGHLMGDKVLIKVAEVAKQNTPMEAFCCRYGGEEFGVIMPGKNFEQASRIADNIRFSVPAIRFSEDPTIEIHLSQGLCVLDFQIPELQAIQTIDQIIKLADDELYRAKHEGRNRMCARVFQLST